jgi:uncharacterized Zn-finger protein
MRIKKLGKLAEYEFTCPTCKTVFVADARDVYFPRLCSVPTDTGLPKEIIEMNTKSSPYPHVDCPFCQTSIRAEKGKRC